MSLAVRYAARELRSGVAGFRVFLACLALGVGALAAAGSTAEAFRHGLASQTRSILGGDLAVSVQGRRFTAGEIKAFKSSGAITDTIGVNAMAASPGERRLANVRGVDSAYPLAGAVETFPKIPLPGILKVESGVPGAAVDPDLLKHLDLKLGDRFLIGDSPFVVRAALLNEPDRLGRGFSLGPGVLVSKAALDRSGLIASDALFGETVRIIVPSGDAPAAVAKDLQKSFPASGFRVRGRNEVAAGLGRLIDQLEYFLSFIGLAALVAGGLGVASAVTTYLDARRSSIAVLKVFGAQSGLIRNIYLLQIGALAAIGIVLGLLIGASAPFLLGWIAKNRLPVPVLFALYPEPLLRAAAFGVLAALTFSLAPLARARAAPPAALFRQELKGRLTFGWDLMVLALAALGLGLMTLLTAPSPVVAGVMIAGGLVGFLALWALGQGAALVASRLRRFAHGAVSMGLANLSGRGSAARTAAPSIGFGVALLTAVVLIQSSLLIQVGQVAPATAPSLVFTQIPSEQGPAFDSLISGVLGGLPEDRYRRFPFLTGRIIKAGGAPIDKSQVRQDQRWAFDEDVTMSALATAPADNGVLQGHWWPADYAGPPLVMLDYLIGEAAGLKVGQSITLEVLGRDLDARVAGLRRIEWSGFGASFPVILNRDALKGANLRQVAIARASKAEEDQILAKLAASFPSVNVINVREQLEQVTKIFDNLAWAVRGAAAVAALAGLLVLVGAIAATAQRRAKEAAILKVLGSTRGEILAAYCVEYGLVGAIAGLTGIGFGAAAAYPVVTAVFHARWSVDWSGIVVILSAAAGIAAAAGGVGAFVALAAHPAPVLRSD